ncbi:MAG: hypothetical protein GY859_16330 [Desulfobacterales bacterium]|nr:hypothetical protein [Desulfobacterales bacterium]
MEKRAFVLISMFMLLFALAFVNANAAEKWATKEECETRVNEAVKMIGEMGFDAVAEKINNSEKRFRWKDSYIFCTDTAEGKILAHPFQPYIGRIILDMPDGDGKVFMPRILDTGNKKGKGWVDYKALRRASNESLIKSTFVYKVPGKEIIVCAGYYIPKKE